MALSNQASFGLRSQRMTPSLASYLGMHTGPMKRLERLGQNRVSVLGCPSTAFQYGMDNDHPFGFDPSRFGFRTLTHNDARGLDTEVVWLDA